MLLSIYDFLLSSLEYFGRDQCSKEKTILHKTSIVIAAMTGEIPQKIWGWKVQLLISKVVFSLLYQFLWTGQLLRELTISYLHGFLFCCSPYHVFHQVLSLLIFSSSTYYSPQLILPPILNDFQICISSLIIQVNIFKCL